MDIPVTIITRDINGNREEHEIRWKDVCSSKLLTERDEELEILIVVVDCTCIYSRLASGPITWDDVAEFFA